MLLPSCWTLVEVDSLKAVGVLGGDLQAVAWPRLLIAPHLLYCSNTLPPFHPFCLSQFRTSLNNNVAGQAEPRFHYGTSLGPSSLFVLQLVWLSPKNKFSRDGANMRRTRLMQACQLAGKFVTQSRKISLTILTNPRNPPNGNHRQEQTLRS
jgi:hypothetical protein